MADTDIRFTTGMVTDLAGATWRQLDSWARSGLLRPSAKAAAGKGTRRLYTFRDVVAAMTVVELRRHGCPLQRVKKAVRRLRRDFPDESNTDLLSRLTLLTDGESVYLLTAPDEIVEVVTRQSVWAVALGRLVLEARKKVAALPMEWTHRVKVRGQPYTLRVTRDRESGGFMVQCVELPAALSEGETIDEAVTNGTDAIESVLAFLERRDRQAEGAVRAKAG